MAAVLGLSIAPASVTMSAMAQASSQPNWYQSPLAVDGALIEPLKKALPGREVLRAAVRSLLVRRAILPHELTAMEAAGLGPLDLSAAFAKLGEETGTKEKDLMAGPGLPGRARGTNPLRQDSLATHNPMLRVLIKAMAHVVRTTPQIAGLVASDQLNGAIGQAVARIMAEECFPSLGRPDPNAGLRQAAQDLFATRSFGPDALEGMGVMDRAHLAARLESRLELMAQVVPPARAEMLERVVRVAGVNLRRNPPLGLDELNEALAAVE